MSASASDLLQEVGIATATTLDSNYTISDSTVTVASTSGWPTATGVTFAIDVVDANGVQVAGSYNEYVGTVATATSVSNVSHANGTDRNYSAGATTRVYIPVSAERENRIVEWGVAEHNQDGTHSDVTADSITTNAGGSVDFSETPLATTDIDDNAVTTAKIAADAVTAAKIDWASTGAGAGIWWEELGRTTLTGAGDTITVSSFSTRKYLRVMATLLATGGTISDNWRFNSDPGSNYVRRFSTNGGADASQTSQSSLIAMTSSAANNLFLSYEIMNITAQEKLVTGLAEQSGTAGAGNAVTRIEFGGKWANTSNQVSTIEVSNSGTGDYAIGSEIVVLGHD